MGVAMSVLSVIPLGMSASYVRARVRRIRMTRTTDDWVQFLREDLAALRAPTT
jgi:hypothetical protein